MILRLLIALFDFDSTLFDLKGFVRALPLAAEAAFPGHQINHERFADEITSFYVKNPEGELVGYDVDAHFLSHGIDLSSDDNRQRLVEQMLEVHHRLTGRPNFLFEDVAETLAWLQSRPGTDVAIVTVNLVGGYTLKRMLCGGLLDHIPAWIVDSNKGVLLTQLWSDAALVYNGIEYAAALVVDDNPEQVAAVPSDERIMRVQVVRPHQKYPANQQGIRVMASLTELRHVLPLTA